MADLVEFFCSGSAVQRSVWAKLEKRVPVSEAEKKRRRAEAANAVTPLSVVDLVLLLKIPRRRYYCARFACDIARTSAHSTRFVDFCARYVPFFKRENVSKPCFFQCPVFLENPLLFKNIPCGSPNPRHMQKHFLKGLKSVQHYRSSWATTV